MHHRAYTGEDRNRHKLQVVVSTNPQEHFTLALLSKSVIPHSFLKYIFLSRKRYKNREIPPEVIAHEATHVRQKHSLDILFIEISNLPFSSL